VEEIVSTHPEEPKIGLKTGLRIPPKIGVFMPKIGLKQPYSWTGNATTYCTEQGLIVPKREQYPPAGVVQVRTDLDLTARAGGMGQDRD